MEEIEDVNVNEEETFQNIDHKNKTVAITAPSKMTDIDVEGDFYAYIMDSAEKSTLDVSTLNSFTTISRSRDSVYTLLDLMAEDPMISSAIKIYAADVCEPNDAGQIVWCDCDDPKILNMVTTLLDSLSIDKNSIEWTTSLIKYGDLYLRLFRQSDFLVFDKYIKDFRKSQEDARKKKLDENYVPEETRSLEEELKIYDYSKNDRYADYIEAIKNPAQVFDLQKYGKSYGYIKTSTAATNTKNDVLQPKLENRWSYKFDQDDVELYEATEFVHACLVDNSSRTTEEISLINNTEDEGITFNVKRGQSLLYNSFKIWRELTLLENAVLLNRITQSSIIRSVSVEVGDLDPSEAKNVLRRVKQMFEQKSAINVGNNMQDYTNSGPVQNTIYIPTHGGIGNITISSTGGDVKIGELTDLDYWKDKLAGSLGIPKQFLGDTSDSAGFNGGESLSLISSRYAKTVKSIQNIYLQAITDVINLMLYDRGLSNYINKFSLKMQGPTTQEEKDRRDNMVNQLSAIRSVMELLDPIEDKKIKLQIVKSLLSDAINNEVVTQLIQEEIDRDEEIGVEEESSDDFDFGGDIGDLGGETEEAPVEEEPASTEMGGAEETPVGEESFLMPRGKEALNERDNLETFKEMNMSYRDVR